MAMAQNARLGFVGPSVTGARRAREAAETEMMDLTLGSNFSAILNISEYNNHDNILSAVSTESTEVESGVGFEGTSTPAPSAHASEHHEATAGAQGTSLDPHSNQLTSAGNHASSLGSHSSNRIPPAKLAIQNPWQPGIWRQLPWLGAGALFGAFICMCATIIVLVASDGRPIEEWSYRFTPQVWLAIFSSLADPLYALAVAEGVTIAFWRKAMHGCTLEKLHSCWETGSGIAGTIQSIVHRRFTLVIIVALFSTISVIRNPFFQSSSKVNNVLSPQSGMMSLRVAPELFPTTRWWTQIEKDNLNRNLTEDSNTYFAQSPMAIEHSDCGDNCTAVVEGFGWGINCTEPTLRPELSFNLNQTKEQLIPNATQYNTDVIGGVNFTVLGVNFKELDFGDIQITTQYKNTSSCQGNLSGHQCILTFGVVTYPIKISAKDISLSSQDWSDGQLVRARKSENDISRMPTTRLITEELLNVIIPLFKVTAILSQSAGYYPPGKSQQNLIKGWQDVYWTLTNVLRSNGLKAEAYERGNTHTPNSVFGDTALGASTDSCHTTYLDPMDDILSGIRAISFRIALRTAAHNLDEPAFLQSVQYSGLATRPVYFTDRRWLWTAATIAFLGILCIMPLYWKFWELGRKVSMSPIELANAFGAPLLRGADGNADAEMILKVVGNDTLTYGAVDAADLTAPVSHDDLAAGSAQQSAPRRRLLKISNDASAMPPYIGEVFLLAN